MTTLTDPTTGDARWAEYDFGSDAVAGLRTAVAVRTLMLSRFGAGQLRPGEPLYTLQERFTLAYLHHRFALRAVQQLVGGQLLPGAVAGDGQATATWVDAKQERAALAALIDLLSPAPLDVPETVAASLLPAPGVMPPSREQIASEAGDAFSVLTAARVLTGLVVDPLLAPDRAARLTLPRAKDALTLAETEKALVKGVLDAPAAKTPRLQALQRVAQRAVVDALIDLWVRPEASPEVRAATLATLEALRTSLAAKRPADTAGAAHVKLLEHDLREVMTRPEARKPRVKPVIPPGRPIGEIGW